MNRLTLFSNSHAETERLRRQVAGFIEVRAFAAAQIPEIKPDQFTLVATSLKDTGRLLDLKDWMKSRPRDGKVIFVTDAELPDRDHARIRHRRDRCNPSPGRRACAPAETCRGASARWRRDRASKILRAGIPGSRGDERQPTEHVLFGGAWRASRDLDDCRGRRCGRGRDRRQGLLVLGRNRAAAP